MTLDRPDMTVRLTGASLVLTRAGAALLRRSLRVDGVVAGKWGRLSVSARRTGRSGSGGGSGGAGPGGGSPKSGPISGEPPTLPRPATAVDATGVSLAWHPRDSWVRYLSSGVGPNDGLFASGGATKAPATDTASHPCSDVPYAGSGQFDYRYDFAAKPGSWYDPASGNAALYGQGNARFRWESHTIDLMASDPEIEIAGASTRAIFRFDGAGGTAIPNRRAVLTTLSMAGQPAASGGGAYTYSAMRGTLTEDGEAVFAGFYPEGEGFGCVSASFSTAP
jgi:hypothetical protein